MDTLDKRIVDAIQSGFPLEAEPFRAVAEQLGAEEAEVMERIARMQAAGTIREIGPVFDLKKLGYTSTLCAARTRPDCVGAVSAFINGFDEVTHNYLRDDPLNIWFTLIAPDAERIEAILNAIRGEEGVDEVLSLPATKLFKIKVQFNTAGDD